MNFARSCLLIVLVGLLHSLGTGSAFAEEKCAGLAGAKAMVTVIDRFLHFAEASRKDLGLTDEHIQKLRATGLALEKDAIKGEADVQLAWLDLQTLLHGEKPDVAAMEAKLKQIEGVRTGIHLAAIKARLEATSMLTPENREKVRLWWRQAREKEAEKGRRLEGHDSEAATKHAEETGSQIRKP
jgi:Spy/CpxP family protein refolding chaperone